MQLLHRRIIVGMDDLRVRRVGNLIPGFHRVSGKNHILVENGFLRKSAKFQVNIPPVCRADIGTEIRLDSQLVLVLFPFQTAHRRIIKVPRIPFNHTAVRRRKLSRICCRHTFRSIQRLQKLFHQIPVIRHAVVRHADADIRI